MGFDISGVKPVSEDGVYFRNNVWWWRPLWSYICETCDDIITLQQANSGTFNDGIEITGRQSKKIYLRLKELKKKGLIAKHEVKHEAERLQEIKDSPDVKGLFVGGYPFSADNVDKFAHFCKESGGFEIW